MGALKLAWVGLDIMPAQDTSTTLRPKSSAAAKTTFLFIIKPPFL
jgi:hypothetical protein